MSKFHTLIVFALLLFSITSLELGECVQRHSDGWSCLKCRANYHLFEGKCYIDILGCNKYHNGAICQQCQPHYMLMNNLCCDQICLSKIFSINKEATYIRNYTDKSQGLSFVMVFIQKSILNGSRYQLEAVQSKQLLKTTRYQLLYHIMNSYQGAYTAKRAIVDYDPETKIILLVDWQKVSSQSLYSKVEKIEISSDQYLTILKQFPQLYPSPQAASSYKIYQHNLTQVKEYQVLYYNTKQSKVYLQVFYRNADKITLLINETDPIDTFHSYRKRYLSQAEVTQASKNNHVLQEAVKYVLKIQIMQQKTLKFVIEWANTPKIIFFRFHAQNTTHIVQIVLQYSSTTNIYNVVSQHAKKKQPSKPHHIDIPHSSSNIKQKDGEKHEKLDYQSNKKILDGFLINIQEFIKTITKAESTTTTTITTADYNFILNLFQHKPKLIYLLTNCKYVEITLQYFVDNAYIYVYFLQQRKSRMLSYAGYLKNTQQKDLSDKGEIQYEASQFDKVFGFKPTFTKESVKKVALRENNVFRRKTITVDSDLKKIDKYYLYFSLDKNQATKLYNCVCRAQKKTKNRQIWTDSIGIQGIRSNDIAAILSKDPIAVQVLNFIKASNPQFLYLDVIQIELDEYDLTLQYVISFGNKDINAIAVVIHDKKDHTNSLISLDFIDHKEYQKYNQTDNTTLILPQRLTKEELTSTIVNIVVKKTHDQILHPTILGAIRQREAPSAQKNILLVRDEKGVFWAIISITNIKTELTKIDPYIQALKVIQPSVVQTLIKIYQNDNTDTSYYMLDQVDEIESITSGVIYDGEVFQIDYNVKPQKLTPAIKHIIDFIIEKEGVKELSGKLLNIEQHSDLIATEFSINYEQTNSTFTRYFVLKISQGDSLIYMGKDSTKQNPQKNIYFKPSDPLKYAGNEQKFKTITETIQTKQNKKYSQKCKTNIWNRGYPLGEYDVVYLKDEKQAAAAYIIYKEKTYKIIRFIEGQSQNLQKKIPHINIQIQPKKQKKYYTGLIHTEVQNIDEQKIKQRYQTCQKIAKHKGQKSKEHRSHHKNQKTTSEEIPFVISPLAEKPASASEHPVVISTLGDKPASASAQPVVISSKGEKPASEQPVVISTLGEKHTQNSSQKTLPAEKQTSDSTEKPFLISPLAENEAQTSQEHPFVISPMSDELDSTNQTLDNLLQNHHIQISCDQFQSPTKPPSYLQIALIYLSKFPQSKTCSLTSYQETKFTSGVSQNLIFTCTKNTTQVLCNSIVSISSILQASSNGFECKTIPPPKNTTSTNTSSKPEPAFVPPIIVVPTSNQTTPIKPLTPTEAGKNIQDKIQNLKPQLIDPNEAYEQQAIKLIVTAEQSDKNLTTITTQITALNEIVIYLRASYIVLDKSAVIKISQDTSYTINKVQRYVLYFFVTPETGQNYIVYRAVVDYDQTTQQTRILILAFDKYIIDNAIVSKVPASSKKQTKAPPKLDIDIAFGYEKIQLNQTATDKNLQTILSQINTKYAPIVKTKILDSVESLQLKNGKLNYKIIYTDPTTHNNLKFVVYYDPSIKKVLVLNTVNLPASQQFSELSQAQKASDDTLPRVLKLLNNLHQTEMTDYKLQCVSRGEIDFNTRQYHITWSSKGKQYRSIVKLFSGLLSQISFGQIQTISLDHYRLDEFEKMFILNYQKLAEGEYKTDTNFHLAYEALMNNNASLTKATFIGAAQKPLGLGYIYHIFSRLPTGEIIRSEVVLELYTLKATIKSTLNQDFNTSLLALNQADTSVKKILSVLEKQATSPSLLSGKYAILTVQAKDFLFGRLFVINIGSNEQKFRGYLYHDHSSEQVMLLNWGPIDHPSGCAKQSSQTCTQCIQGYQKVNNICVFGCGVICKNVKF